MQIKFYELDIHIPNSEMHYNKDLVHFLDKKFGFNGGDKTLRFSTNSKQLDYIQDLISQVGQQFNIELEIRVTDTKNYKDGFVYFPIRYAKTDIPYNIHLKSELKEFEIL